VEKNLDPVSIDRPTSFYSSWCGDSSSGRGSQAIIPLDWNIEAREQIVFEAKTKLGQTVQVIEDILGDRTLHLNGDDFQICMHSDGSEYYYGDDSNYDYIKILNFLKLREDGFSRLRILIIGGGDLGLCQLLMDHGVRQITIFELDRELHEIFIKWFPRFKKSPLESDGVRIEFGDGFERLALCEDDSFDVIIGDLPDYGASQFSDTSVSEDLIRVCRSDGAVLTHWANGDFDFNSAYASFHAKSAPLLVVMQGESEGVGAFVWSPKPLGGINYAPAKKI
tara:strand:+ start:229 stop:1068 length:840 start_codon:yes stop_codon:yes gene_type:complete